MRLPELKRIRKSKRMSIEDLANAARVPGDRIVSIEERDNSIYPKTAEKLAKALGVTVEALTGKPDPTQVTQKTGADKAAAVEALRKQMGGKADSSGDSED